MEYGRPLHHLNKATMKTTQMMLVSIPSAGLVVYCLFLHAHFARQAAPWYGQLLLFAILYIADIYMHEFIHGLFDKIFNPDEKVQFHFGVLGSSCGMEHCSFRIWQFILMVIAPAVVLFVVNLLFALLIPQFFTALYFIAVIGLASGSNDFLLAYMTLKQAHAGEFIISGEKTYEIIEAKDLAKY